MDFDTCPLCEEPGREVRETQEGDMCWKCAGWEELGRWPTYEEWSEGGGKMRDPLNPWRIENMQYAIYGWPEGDT